MFQIRINLRRVKKTFRKTNIGQVSGKVNEGDEIKTTLDLFLKKLIRAMRKHSRINSFSSEMSCFYGIGNILKSGHYKYLML